VLVALTAAQAAIYLLARNGGLTVNGQSAFILTVLVLGAGPDYALLLTARHREELGRHGHPEPAVPAGGRAELDPEPGPGDDHRRRGRPVRQITLLPALLVIFGRWVF
jgi:RND superfamily putative drug exporter